MPGFFDGFFNPHRPIDGVGPMPSTATPMMDPMQARFAMSMLNKGQEEAVPQMQPMMAMQQMQPAMSGQQANQFLQQYSPMGEVQQQNDEMMRQRMQGLMAMLGGQQ